jgi:hypothetical protein
VDWRVVHLTSEFLDEWIIMNDFTDVQTVYFPVIAGNRYGFHFITVAVSNASSSIHWLGTEEYTFQTCVRGQKSILPSVLPRSPPRLTRSPKATVSRTLNASATPRPSPTALPPVGPNVATYSRTFAPAVTRTPHPSPSRSQRRTAFPLQTPWPTGDITPVVFSSEDKTANVSLSDQDASDPPIEFHGTGTIVKDKSVDEYEDLTLQNTIIAEGANVSLGSPLNIGRYLGIFGGEIHGGQMGIRLLSDDTILELRAGKRNVANGIGLLDSSDDYVQPLLDLGNVGDDYQGLPSMIVPSPPPPTAIVSDKPWIQALNLTNCEDWKELAEEGSSNDTRANFEWICKMVEYFDPPRNGTGLFLTDKQQAVKSENPVNTEGNTPNDPDDKNSYGLIIGISVGAGGVVIGVMIGLITYFRLKGSKKKGCEPSKSSSSEEEENVENVKRPASPRPVPNSPPKPDAPVAPNSPSVPDPRPVAPFDQNQEPGAGGIPDANIGEDIRTTAFGTIGPDDGSGNVISI